MLHSVHGAPRAVSPPFLQHAADPTTVGSTSPSSPPTEGSIEHEAAPVPRAAAAALFDRLEQRLRELAREQRSEARQCAQQLTRLRAHLQKATSCPLSPPDSSRACDMTSFAVVRAGEHGGGEALCAASSTVAAATDGARAAGALQSSARRWRESAVHAYVRAQLGRLWREEVEQWFDECVVHGFYVTVLQRLAVLRARVLALARRLRGSYGQRLPTETSSAYSPAASSGRTVLAPETEADAKPTGGAAACDSLLSTASSLQCLPSHPLPPRMRALDDDWLRRTRRPLARLLCLLLKVVPETTTALRVAARVRHGVFAAQRHGASPSTGVVPAETTAASGACTAAWRALQEWLRVLAREQNGDVRAVDALVLPPSVRILRELARYLSSISTHTVAVEKAAAALLLGAAAAVGDKDGSATWAEEETPRDASATAGPLWALLLEPSAAPLLRAAAAAAEAAPDALLEGRDYQRLPTTADPSALSRVPPRGEEEHSESVALRATAAEVRAQLSRLATLSAGSQGRGHVLGRAVRALFPTVAAVPAPLSGRQDGVLARLLSHLADCERALQQLALEHTLSWCECTSTSSEADRLSHLPMRALLLLQQSALRQGQAAQQPQQAVVGPSASAADAPFAPRERHEVPLLVWLCAYLRRVLDERAPPPGPTEARRRSSAAAPPAGSVAAVDGDAPLPNGFERPLEELYRNCPLLYVLERSER